MKEDTRTKKLQLGEIIPLTYDFAFTEIFNNEKNIKVLEYLIEAVTDYSLDEIQGNLKILSRDLNIENRMERSSEIDLLLDLNGTKVNIELSNRMSLGTLQRDLIYGCYIHSKQLKYGDNDYSEISPTIQIQFNNFRCDQSKVKRTYLLRDETGEILLEDFRIEVIDMVLAKKLWYTNRVDKLMRWCKLLMANTIKEMREVIGDDLMDEISRERFIEELIKFNEDPSSAAKFYMKLSKEELERNTYRKEAEQKGREEGEKKGFKNGIKEGLKEGRKDGLKMAAKNLKQSGMPIDEIAKIVELDIAEIEQL